MRKTFGILRRLLIGDEGPTSVEYAIMLSLIAAVCVAGVRTIGANASTAPTRVADSLANSSSGLGSNPVNEISVKRKHGPVDCGYSNPGIGKGNGSSPGRTSSTAESPR
jgi:Flp pilus assembly pilin Flp